MWCVNMFLGKAICADEFVEIYFEQFRVERDSGDILRGDATLGEIITSIFCIADMYNPRNNRKDYEFDETRMRMEIEKTIKRLSRTAGWPGLDQRETPVS